ncbi:hypothetical protein llg_11160 [Luteolibacter sp. LG18]|nr:hypothetical protein llg_11160 [Luteolibacter sp. LG18]
MDRDNDMKDIINPYASDEVAIGIERSIKQGRSLVISEIFLHQHRLIHHTGKIYLTSKDVLDALHELGIQYWGRGRKLTKPNAIGDVLGKHGMNLPHLMIEGKKHYFLGAVGMSESQREAFDKAPDEEKAKMVDQAIEYANSLIRAFEQAALDDEEDEVDSEKVDSVEVQPETAA